LIKYKKIIGTISACAVLVLTLGKPVNIDGSKNHCGELSDRHIRALLPVPAALEWLKSNNAESDPVRRHVLSIYFDSISANSPDTIYTPN